MNTLTMTKAGFSRTLVALVFGLFLGSPVARAAAFIPIGSVYTDPMGTSSGWSISGDGTTVVGNLNVATEVPVPGLPGYTYTQYTQTAFSWQIGSSVTLLPFFECDGRLL
jgi:hypothetical protein